MFLALLLVTFVVSVVVAAIVARMFAKPIDGILHRIIADEISSAWLKYMKFSILVVGVSAGVRVHELERYISPARHDKEARVLELSSERWILEIYRTSLKRFKASHGCCSCFLSLPLSPM